MSKLLLGIICGIVFGGISVATMIPIEMEDKRTAMAGAFVNRFAIGFAIGATNLPMALWLSGLLFGVLLSLPDAIITKGFGSPLWPSGRSAASLLDLSSALGESKNSNSDGGLFSTSRGPT